MASYTTHTKTVPRAPFPVVSPRDVCVDEEKVDEVDELIREGIDAGDFAGASVAMARDNKVFYWRHLGHDSLEKKTELNDATIFRLKSLGKTITATAVLILVEKGKLQLDDAISKFIPAFANAKVYDGEGKPPLALDRPITIRDCMTHTSGLLYANLDMEGIDVPDGLNKQIVDRQLEFWTAKEWYNVAAEVPLLAQPGTMWAYGVSPEILGRVIEVVTGQVLQDFYKENIFSPLKMKDTSFFVPKSQMHRAACRYNFEDGKLVNVPHATDPDYYFNRLPEELENGKGHCCAGAGLYGTLADCMLFAMMLANRGELNGHRVLKASTVAEMYANQLPENAVMPAPGWHFGFGGMCIPAFGDCWGWSGVTSTHLQIFFQNGLSFVVLRQLQPLDMDLLFKINIILSQAVLPPLEAVPAVPRRNPIAMLARACAGACRKRSGKEGADGEAAEDQAVWSPVPDTFGFVDSTSVDAETGEKQNIEQAIRGMRVIETVRFHAHKDLKDVSRGVEISKGWIKFPSAVLVLGNFDARGEPHEFAFPEVLVPKAAPRGTYTIKCVYEASNVDGPLYVTRAQLMMV